MFVWLKRGLFLALSLAVILIITVYWFLSSSQARLDGQYFSSNLKAPVSIERDNMGIPVIKGSNREDVAFATGYLHAQDRFFQMDLNRRNSAGELSELVGNLALNHDKTQRKHRFRKVARQVVQQMTPDERTVINAYTTGVNEGLTDLKSKPFEYWLLNVEPELWMNEDSLLAVFSMYMDLNDNEFKLDDTKGFLSRLTTSDVVEFLSPLRTRWDSSLVPMDLPTPVTPNSSLVDLRSKPTEFYAGLTGEIRPDSFIGSNNWAVSGNLTSTGAAMVEDDMHLAHRVPTIWYRAQFNYPDPIAGDIQITGVTLPGAPIMVVGSNGHIAWGFTNSYGDWVDLVLLEMAGDNRYMAGNGPETLETWKEVIKVKGQEAVTVEYQQSLWGPVVDSRYDSSRYAMRWTAHNPAATNIKLIELEKTTTVSDAIKIANKSGIPPQNFTVGDKEGNIAWTIAGRIPLRSGVDSTFPLSWQEAEENWQSWLAIEDYPKIVNPESDRIWTANARIASGDDLQKIGDGGYLPGPRQKQIEDSLSELTTVDETKLLTVALDHRALYMENWRQLILGSLQNETDLERKEFLSYVENWSGKAATDDVGYRLVREFHDALNLKVTQSLGRYFRSLTVDSRVDFKDGWLQSLNHDQEMLLRLYQEQPKNWLSPKYNNWNELYLETIDEVIATLGGSDKLAQATWGQRNTSAINHPLSKALPIIGQWLNMPKVELSGDVWMPKAQKPAAGISERMIVSPGHEDQAIFHMPGGQSGHPLSPFYKAGYMDWVEGKESAFLPGKAKYDLQLMPAE